jgi:hypothetical protein
MLSQLSSAEDPLSVARGDPRVTDAPEQASGPTCAWCSSRFTPRQSGGRRQRFCSKSCRRASEKAIREWAQGALVAGRVTVAEIKRER